MRQLHVIGFTSDHSGLILAGRRGAKTGGFVLHIDDALLEHLEPLQELPGTGDEADDRYDDPAPDHAREPEPAADPEPRPARPAVQSGLNPREIQARLRAGRTVEEVAAEAGVSTDWVDRFAAPVLAEQAAAVARAAETVLHTARRGSSDRPLEGSVLRNLADRGVVLTGREFAEGWSAFHLIDHDWLVRFRFRSRGRALVAEWTLDTASGTLTARNRLGTELGFVTPGRPAAVLSDVEGPPDTPARPKAPARKSTKAPARPKASTRARVTEATPRVRTTAKKTASAPARRTAPSPVRARANGEAAQVTTTAKKAAPASAGRTTPAKATGRKLAPTPAARSTEAPAARTATTRKPPAATPRPPAPAPVPPRRPDRAGATTGGAGADRVAAVRRSAGAPQLPAPPGEPAARTGRSAPVTPTGPPPVSGLLARTAGPATDTRPAGATSRPAVPGRDRDVPRSTGGGPRPAPADQAGDRSGPVPDRPGPNRDAPAGADPRRTPDSNGSDGAYRRLRGPEAGPRPASIPATQPRPTQAPAAPAASPQAPSPQAPSPQAPSPRAPSPRAPSPQADGPAARVGASGQPDPGSGVGEPGRFRRFRAGRPDRPLRAVRRPAAEEGPAPGRSEPVAPQPPAGDGRWAGDGRSAGDRRPTGGDGPSAPTGRPVIRAGSARSGPGDPTPGPGNGNGNGRVRILDDRAVPPRPGPRG